MLWFSHEFYIHRFLNQFIFKSNILPFFSTSPTVLQLPMQIWTCFWAGCMTLAKDSALSFPGQQVFLILFLLYHYCPPPSLKSWMPFQILSTSSNIWFIQKVNNEFLELWTCFFFIEKKRKHFYYWINIEPEHDMHNRQCIKRCSDRKQISSFL